MKHLVLFILSAILCIILYTTIVTFVEETSKVASITDSVMEDHHVVVPYSLIGVPEIIYCPVPVNGLNLNLVTHKYFNETQLEYINHGYMLALSNGDTLRFDDYPSDEVLVMLYYMERAGKDRR